MAHACESGAVARQPSLPHQSTPTDAVVWKPLGCKLLDTICAQPCTFSILLDKQPLLHSNLSQVVLRCPWQWGLLLSLANADLQGGNGRNKVLHGDITVEAALNARCFFLHNLDEHRTTFMPLVQWHWHRCHGGAPRRVP